MKFRNATSDDLKVPVLDITVDAGGETPDLTDEQAAGFADQAGKWEPVQPAPAPTTAPAAAAKEND